MSAKAELLEALKDMLDKMEATKPLRTAACRRARALIARVEAGESEIAWLVEQSFDDAPHWWYGSDFTADANEAVRFCRKEDAEQVILERGLVDARATEHMWQTVPEETSSAERSAS